MASPALKPAVVVAVLCALLVLSTGLTQLECIFKCHGLCSGGDVDDCKADCGSSDLLCKSYCDLIVSTDREANCLTKCSGIPN